LLLLLLLPPLLLLVQLTCVAELAAWDVKTHDSPLCNDHMYVMIYDGAATLEGAHMDDNYKQTDGFARTIHFVRLEDFVNW
jgi:hypothetical protein